MRNKFLPITLRMLLTLAFASAFLPTLPAHAAATIYTSTATGGAWSSPSTWANNNGSYPGASDSVVIATTAGNNVSLDTSPVISGSLTINSGATLITNGLGMTLGGDFINNGGTFAASTSSITLSGLTNQSIAGFTITGALLMTKTAGTATLTGNVNAGALTINGPGGTLNLGTGTHTFTGTWTRSAGTLNAGSSTLNLNGTMSGTAATFIPGTGTVIYGAAAAQTVATGVYTNLILSGSGAKTLTGVTVNGTLTMSGTGTATASVAPIYGSGATLVYNRSALQTAGPEWITPFVATGGVVIAGTGTVKLNNSKAFTAPASLTINSGATLETANLALTFGGNFTNNGTLTGGNSNIILSGTANQSIGSFAVGSGLVSMTKTAGTATFTGNVTAGGLTINGSGGTLNLGAGTHTFTGTWTRTAGTLNAGSSTLNLNGGVTGTGGTFTAGTSTVNYGGGGQSVAGVSYYNLSTGGSAAKTTIAAVTVSGHLTIGTGTTLTVAGYPITVLGTTSVSGTLTHNNSTGAKLYTGPVTINAGGAWTNSGNAPINLRGGLAFNGTSFAAGTGLYTFDTNPQAISGTLAIPNLAVNGISLTNNGTLTVATALSGTGSLIQGSSAGLTIGGTSTIASLTAAAASNLVTYSGAAQTVMPTPYYNLTLSGSGVKTLTGVNSIGGGLTLGGTVSATTAATLVIGGDLTLGTLGGPADALSTAAATTIGGNLKVNSGTLTVGGADFSVAGTTGISGTLIHNNALGAKTYSGLVTINSGGIWNNSGNANITLRGGLNHGGTVTAFIAGSGVYTFDTNNQTISGTIAIPNLTVNGSGITLTNSGTLTVASALSGTGGIVQAVVPSPGATLNIGGAATIAGLNAVAALNTVNYNGAVQTVIPTAYFNLTLSGSAGKALDGVTTIGGNLSLGGTASATTAANLNIGVNLVLANGTTLTVGGFNFNVAGNTTDGGTLAFNSNSGTKTFVGPVTVSSGRTWSNAGNANVNFQGGLTNSGTFTAGLGTYTFDTNDQTITGATATTIANLTVTGITLTNNGSLTVSTALAGSGTLAQGTIASPGATLNLGGASSIGTLAASAPLNTIIYSLAAGTQAVFPTSYNNLTLSNGVKTLAGVTSINGNLLMTSGANVTLTSDLTVGANLTINAGATLDVSASNYAINLSGNWSNSGTFTPRAGTVALQGSATQTLTGAAVPFNNLTINSTNPSGVTLTSPINVSGVLTFANGKIVTNANVVILGLSGTVTGANASRYVAGNMRKLYSTGTGLSFTYEIGDATNYTPVSLVFASITNNGSGTGGMMASTTGAEHPNIATSGLDATRDVNRYWTLTTAGTFVYTTLSATFNFVPGDIDAGTSPADFMVKKYVSPNWSLNNTNIGTRTATSTQATGISGTGALSFAVGNTPIVSTTLSVTAINDVYGNPVSLTAALAPIATGESIDFYLNGVLQGSASTNASGIATLAGVALDVNSGSYPAVFNTSGVGAGFAGDVFYGPSSGAAALTVSKRAITVAAASDSKEYDGTDSSSGLPAITSGSLLEGDTGGWTQTFANKNVGTGKTLTPAGSINDGNGGGNYAVTFANNTNGAITRRAITVSATSDSKGFDGTNTSSGIPSISSGSLAAGDSAIWTQTFDTRNAGEGKTLTPAGLVSDGNGGANYSVTLQSDTTGSISQRAITVSAASDTRVYNATTTSNGLPAITSGGLAAGDSAAWTQSFDDRNVGNAKTLTPAGTITDGNGGVNYNVTFVENTSGVITTRPITVTAAADTRVYDASAVSDGVPTITSGSLAGSDTASWTQSFDDANAGSGKTLTPAGSVSDGNGGTNYAVTFDPNTSGVITPRAITVSAVTDAKGYDGNTSSSGLPTITSGSLLAGDSAVWMQLFDNRNAGTGKALIPGGVISDGNGGGNYAITFVNQSDGAISARAITVTAVSDTKVYDATTGSSGTPTITSGSLAGSDTAVWTQSFDTQNIGSGKTITPGGSATDGNGGHNYSVTFVTDTSGAITARAITVSAVSDTKGYDRSTSSSGVPLITSGSLAGSDTAAWSQAFDTKDMGSGKTLTPSGSISDGNAGGNYSITFVENNGGVITARPITVTAAAQTRVYDATTASTGLPTITAGSLLPGDTAIWSQVFNSPNAGAGKTIVPTGTVSDGNSGGNYSVTFVNNGNGVITTRPISVTAVSDMKGYDAGTASSGLPEITSGTLAGADSGSWTQSFSNPNAGTGKTIVPTGTVSDGNGGSNYSVTFFNNSTGVITARPISVTATSDTKTYDGTTASAAVPTITSGILAGSDSAAWTQAFDSRNVGSGKSLTPSGTVNDGNGGANYTVSFVPVTGGVISVRPITVTAASDTRGYDATTASSAVPGITSGALATGDSATWTQTFETRDIGSGKTLIPAGSVSDGNAGGNYDITFVANTTGTIIPRAITVSATGDTKPFDGSNSSTAVPTITLGSLLSGDTAAWSQTFDNKNAGTGKTLIPAGSVDDGNSGGNYTVTFINNTAGVISPRAITVTAATDSKPYDGTNSSTGVPTITGGSLLAGDSSVWSQTFDNKNAGSGKSLIPAGTITDGNAGHNYTVTFVDEPTGVINVAAITVTADPQTKTYGDADPLLSYQVSTGSLLGSDGFSGALARDAGEEAGSYAITQGTLTAGSNYDLTYQGASLTIGSAALGVIADDKSMVAGDPDPVFTFRYSGLKGSDTAALIDTAPLCGVSDPHTALGSYPIVCSGGIDSDYTLIYTDGTLTVGINQLPTDISLSNAAVQENRAAGALVGSLSSSDPDSGESFSYRLVSGGAGCPGTDNAVFQITSGNLNTAAMFDFEKKKTYAICIQSLDSHAGAFQKPFTVSVLDLPETFSSSGALDGWVLESAEASNKGGTLNATSAILSLGDDIANKQYRGILSFDTSALPDNAIVTLVIIKLKTAGIIGTNPFIVLGKLLVDIRKPFFGTTSALNIADFQAAAGKANVGAIPNKPAAGWYSTKLAATANANINLKGTTQFRLHFTLDDNNNHIAEAMKFYSGNLSTAASRPTLVIQYRLP